MVMVMMLVIRIILGSYLQFGGCTVSIAQMCRGTSWFIHSHFSVSIAPHSSAHIVPDIVISQPTLLPSLLVGCFCTWWVGGVVQGTDYWDFTPGCCPTRPTVLVEETDGNGFRWFPIIGPNKAIDGILKGFKNLQGF